MEGLPLEHKLGSESAPHSTLTHFILFQNMLVSIPNFLFILKICYDLKHKKSEKKIYLNILIVKKIIQNYTASYILFQSAPDRCGLRTLGLWEAETKTKGQFAR